MVINDSERMSIPIHKTIRFKSLWKILLVIIVFLFSIVFAFSICEIAAVSSLIYPLKDTTSALISRDFNSAKQSIQKVIEATESGLWSFIEYIPGSGFQGIVETIQGIKEIMPSSVSDVPTTCKAMNEVISNADQGTWGISPIVMKKLKTLSNDLAYLSEEFESFFEDDEFLYGRYLIIGMTNAEPKTMGGLPGLWAEVDITPDGIDVVSIQSAPNNTPNEYVELVQSFYSHDYECLSGHPMSDAAFELLNFQQTGEATSNLWTMLGHETPRAVIAMDLASFSSLADSLGISAISGHTSDARSLYKYLANTVYFEEATQEDQSRAFSEIAHGVMNKIASISTIEAIDSIDALTDAIKEHRLFAYFYDVDLSEKDIGGNMFRYAADNKIGVFANDRSLGKQGYYLDWYVSLNGNVLTIDVTNRFNVIGNIPEHFWGRYPQYMQPGTTIESLYIVIPDKIELINDSGNCEVQNVFTDDGTNIADINIGLLPGESTRFMFKFSDRPAGVFTTLSGIHPWSEAIPR